MSIYKKFKVVLSETADLVTMVDKIVSGASKTHSTYSKYKNKGNNKTNSKSKTGGTK